MAQSLPDRELELSEQDEETPFRETEGATRAIPGATLLAIALAIGIAAGWHWIGSPVWMWLVLTIGAVIAAIFARRTRAV